ncbi:purine and uridine phosphorylase [Aureobasidium pullulans]|uniref:Purine and uridine phosphorylase n=1 Tax=Aureobasidium pullulans TaxID=5580 RepID=A0A4S9XNX7_AURPU|nr:purine and uridine phosphorylase [Aureobasidium pullulans]
MLNPKDYTVLWICALPLEYVAAQAFLDQEDPKSGVGEISNDDTNAYTLGQIAGHKVVLAVLPKGEIGVGSAASVITHIIRSFPNIRIGLLVGVGGGAPTKDHDIRLGDIVVSSPKDGRSGIYHHDFGKETQETGFQQTGFLNQPPEVVRTAVAALEAKHTLKGHTINQSIEHAMIKNPRLRTRGFARPNPISDCLHKSDVLHSAMGESYMGCCGDDFGNLVLRRQRGGDDDDPAIYYGLIGSGNKLIRNALMRDKLARDPGILCFEMEAAGIMNRMPCLVIRGICDYCDSHKNKDWQGYAAMTAAAYTTELLSEILPKHVEGVEVLAKSLEALKRKMSIVAESIDQIKTSGKSDKIERWLEAPNSSINHNNAIDKHNAGTGQWFLESNHFLEWRQEPNSFLWLHGPSGCGKTILSSTIIETLARESLQLVYFYFDFSDPNKQTLESMLRSMLAQLYLRGCTSAQSVIQDLYDRARGDTASMNQMTDALKSTSERSGIIRIVLDALDEAKSPEDIVNWFRKLRESHGHSVQMIVTSRPPVANWVSEDQGFPLGLERIDEDIGVYVHARLHSMEFEEWNSQLKLCDEVEERLKAKADGMFRWAACQLDDLRSCPNVPAVYAVLDDLPATLNETYARTLETIRASQFGQQMVFILQLVLYSGDYPLSLEACNDALVIDTQSELGFEIRNRFFRIHDVLKFCGGFIDTYPDRFGRSQVRFVHASVQDYLSTTMDESSARRSILSAGIAYLKAVDWSLLSFVGAEDRYWETGTGRVDEEMKMVRIDKRLELQFPFIDGAANSWMENAKYLDQRHEDTPDCMIDFLQRSLDLFGPFFDFLTSGDDPLHRLAGSRLRHPLVLVASLGLAHCFEHLVFDRKAASCLELCLNPPSMLLPTTGGSENSCPCMRYGNSDASANSSCLVDALLEASYHCHDQIVRHLIHYGVNVGAHDSDGYTALEIAAATGDQKTVEMLVNSGALDCSINLGGAGYELCLAATNGNLETLKYLLARGAGINTQCEPYGTALLAAIEAFLYQQRHTSSDLSVIRMLIAHGANVNQPFKTLTPLKAALCTGHMDVLAVLTAAGADIGTLARDSLTLTVSVLMGYTDIVELLLKNGADVHGLQLRQTPLQVAAANGNIVVAKKLLEYGAAVDLVSSGGHHLMLEVWNRASKARYAKTLLLGEREVHSHDEEKQTALQVAASCNDHSMVLLLIECGACVNFLSPSGTALTLACGLDSEAICHKRRWNRGPHLPWYEEYKIFQVEQRQVVSSLLGFGALVDVPGLVENAFTLAVVAGNVAAVKILLEIDALVETADPYGKTSPPSHTTSLECTITTNQLGATVHRLGSRHSTPLQLAASMGFGEIVWKLLEYGVDIDATSPDGCALMQAAKNNRKSTVLSLLDKDHDPSGQGIECDSQEVAALEAMMDRKLRLLEECRCPLCEAVRWRKVSIVELLISRGADVELAIREAYHKGEIRVAQKLRQYQPSISYADWQDDTWTHIFDVDLGQSSQPRSLTTSYIRWEWQSLMYKVGTQPKHAILRRTLDHQLGEAQDIAGTDCGWLELD